MTTPPSPDSTPRASPDSTPGASPDSTPGSGPDDLCRIGDLAERTGVSTHSLRAWEKRFGLLRPVRTSGGYRLYSQADAVRVLRMQQLRDDGVPAGRAAAMVLQEERGTGSVLAAPPSRQHPDDDVTAFIEHTRDFDDAAAHAVLDVALATMSTEDAIEHVFLPSLARIGDQWASGDLTVAHEHFASLLIRSRLTPHTVTWSTGTGPLAVLACPAGERHDIGLIAFGVVLGRAGWQVRCLGADTPWESLVTTVEAVKPEVLVLSAATPGPLEPLSTWLPKLVAARRIAVGGSGAREVDGVELLPASVVAGAAQLATHS